MKEKTKSFLLFFLVLTSILMTQKLWIKIPDIFNATSQADEVIEVSYALSDMIAPDKYLLNFSSNDHTVLYEDSTYGIWDASKGLLVDIFSSEDVIMEEISKGDYIKGHYEKSISFYFPENIKTFILAKALGTDNPNEITDSIPNIKEIFVYLGNRDPFFIFTDGITYIKVRSKNINNTFLIMTMNNIEVQGGHDFYYSMREAYGVDNDLYIPYEINGNFPKVHVSNEILSLNMNEKRKLAERFLNKDIDYINELVETNGSTIFIDGNRVLKLNANGTLEYFHALEDKVGDRNLYTSLNTAADFITTKTYTQREMYLSRIEDITLDENQGYRLTFKYRIRGIPVILGNQEVADYIQIDVFNNHVRNFIQLTRSEILTDLNPSIDAREMLSSFYVIDMNYEILETDYLNYIGKTKEEVGENIVKEVLGTIEDISLAYYDSNMKDMEEQLIETWLIKANNKLYGFNAYTGIFVFER